MLLPPTFSHPFLLPSIVADDSLQKVSLKVIHQQYQNKRGDNKSPWVLRHYARAVNLDSTVGDVNTFDNNVVVLEAVDTPQLGQPPPARSTPSHTGNPLSPKDPNPRLRPAPFAPKPAPLGNHNENSRPSPTIPADNLNYHTRVSPGPNGAMHHHVHYDRLLPDSPTSTPPSAVYIPPNPYGRPSSHTPQQQPLVSAAAQPAFVQVPQGNFPAYRDASIAHYRHYFHGESDGQSITPTMSELTNDLP